MVRTLFLSRGVYGIIMNDIHVCRIHKLEIMTTWKNGSSLTKKFHPWIHLSTSTGSLIWNNLLARSGTSTRIKWTITAGKTGRNLAIRLRKFVPVHWYVACRHRANVRSDGLFPSFMCPTSLICIPIFVLSLNLPLDKLNTPFQATSEKRRVCGNAPTCVPNIVWTPD